MSDMPPPLGADILALADGMMNYEKRLLEKRASGGVFLATDRLIDREIHVKHVAWKFFAESNVAERNEIWIDGVLGVVFHGNEKNEAGVEGTRVNYQLKGDKNVSQDTFFEMGLTEAARWHFAWLTDPNVFIDSASIDMEFASELMMDRRKFRVKHLNMSVQSNYIAIQGWLQHMDARMESFIFRGMGVLDANKFLVLPFALKLKKLMLVHESSFDDRTLNLLTAGHIQIASDSITDEGINRCLHRWCDADYPIRSAFVIYMRIRSTDKIFARLDVQEVVIQDNGVSEFLIQMPNPNKRMRVICRPSSVVCTVFAISNNIAECERL